MLLNCEFIKQFLRFQDSLIQIDRTLSWMPESCRETSQIQSLIEQTFLDKDFAQSLFARKQESRLHKDKEYPKEHSLGTIYQTRQ